MTKTPARHLPLEGSFNIRDLGGYHTADGQTTLWGKVFRADSLHRLTADSQAVLLEQGIRTVVDLRHASELEAAPNPFADRPEVRYLHVSLFEPLYRGGSLGGGNRAGLELTELYRLALEHAQEPIARVLTVIAESDTPVLFHCTAGKDRTGLIAALTLAAAGVEAGTIVTDYALTGEYARPLMAHLEAEAQAKGHDLGQYRKLLLSEPEFMQKTLEHLEAAHGSPRAYLEAIGLSEETLAGLRRRLLG